MAQTKKVLFIICPIKEEGSPPRKRSDQLMRHIIKPVADEKYEVIRSDKDSTPGRIDRQIINHLRNDALVVCDLTDHNANVLYELAIRHAVRKPVVLMGEKDTRPPFDLYTQRVISYDLTDPDKITDSKEELKKQIDSIEESKFIVDTPIEGTEPIYNDKPVGREEILPQILNLLKRTSSRVSSLEDKIDIITQKEKITSLTLGSTPYVGISTLPSISTPFSIEVCKNCGMLGYKGNKCSHCGTEIE